MHYGIHSFAYVKKRVLNPACDGKRFGVFLTFLEKPLGFSRETEVVSVEDFTFKVYVAEFT